MDAATALLGATLAEWQRKREEDAARRAAEYKERLANGRGSYREAAINYQRSLDNFRANLMKAGLTPQQAGALKSQAIVNGKIPSVAEAIASLKNDKSGGGGGKPMFAPARGDVEPPLVSDKIFISITEDELAQLNNLNTIATVIAYVGWFLVGELVNVAISAKFPPFAAPGAILLGAGGIGYGAYESSVLSSVQSEFDEAINNGTDVQVWKNGGQIIVYSGVGETVTVVNSVVAKEYINQVVLLETGERIP